MESDKQPPPLQKANKDRKEEIENKKDELKKGSPSVDPWIDHIEQVLNKSSVFDNYFNDYVEFTTIREGKRPSKFITSDIKFHITKNLYKHVETSPMQRI